MQSEVRFKKKIDGRPVSFAGLRSGVGVIDKHNWPTHFESNQPIREFTLVAEEI